MFKYPWETVIKGFYLKYPTPEMNFVKFNHVIDIEIINEKCLKIKRLMYSHFYKYLWAYSVEEINIRTDDRVLEMKSEIV